MLEDMAVSSIDRQLQINLAGLIYMTKACAPALRESAGSIVNISSGLASKPVPARAVYAATKGAVEAFSPPPTSTSDGTRPLSAEGRESRNARSSKGDWRTSATPLNINQTKPEPPLRNQLDWPT